jgi:hypothetical protein
MRGDAGLANALRLTGSASHTCAFLSNELVCWGSNSNGQLGIGAAPAKIYSATPAPAWDGGIPAALAHGGAHTCAISSKGAVYCWGNNGFGQVGDAKSANDHPLPSAVGLNAVAIACGNAHSCALLSNGDVMCWGWNFQGQLGDTTNMNSPVPRLVNVKATALAAGGDTTCVIKQDKTVACWGANVDGQLGDGTPAIVTAPMHVAGY